MSVRVASLVVDVLAIYVGIGVVFAALFVLWGVGRVDPAARGASWGFRLVVLPGVAALWPLMAKRWIAGPRAPVAEANAHRAAAVGREGGNR